MLEHLKDFVVPSNFCFALGVAGVALFFWRRMRALGGLAMLTSLALLIVFSSGKTAALLLVPLEYEYPRAADMPAPSTEAIVVLAGYAADDANMPLSSRANSFSLYRIVEAVHLSQRCPNCDVIVSGKAPTTTVMIELLQSLGVPETRIRGDHESPNTAASAANVKHLLGEGRFFLVTSAGHMRRAMGVFQNLGLSPIAAPTDYQLPKEIRQADWRVSPFHLWCSDLAVHEYLGIWWYRLRGRID